MLVPERGHYKERGKSRRSIHGCSEFAFELKVVGKFNADGWD